VRWKIQGSRGARTPGPAAYGRYWWWTAKSWELMDLQPGIIRENITTRGINVNGLPVGERLRVGEAQLEVSVVCTPCDLLEKIRPGLRRELRGRRGMLCRVIAGGMIRRGDNIERIS